MLILILNRTELNFLLIRGNFYTTGDSSVIQFDLDQPVLSPFVVYNGFDFIGAIQLGPDGKIYVANSEELQFT